ncbi:MAG: NusG domain II-containing protein [Lachnospiraceae bacterium]|nr:NusG domain II-containing protein [Lachnospiraceae bacterium]
MEEGQKEKNIKKDASLILTLLLVGVGLLLYTYMTKNESNVVEVRVDGTVVQQFSIDDEVTYQIEGVGGSNLLKIENGKAWFSDADCKDKVCMHTGKISLAGQSIICLPHRVVVEIKEKSDEE